MNDMKLNADILPDGTSHYTFRPDYSQGTTGRWRPKIEIWKRGKILGSGSFGTVWIEECASKEGLTKLRAVKMIKKLPHPSHLTCCDQELEAIAKFSQPKVCTALHTAHFMVVNIDQYSDLFVRSFGWFENQEFIFIAMEHICLGNLQDNLTGPVPETEAKQICFQVLQGIQCLHDNDFVHRDLKPEVCCHKTDKAGSGTQSH